MKRPVWNPLVITIASACVFGTLAHHGYGDDEQNQAELRGLRNLVAQLGAQQFVVREAATMQLFERGQGEASAHVMQLLLEAVDTGDREVRNRARRVMGLLKDRLRTEAIGRFVRGDPATEIPGWKQFAAAHKSSPQARGLYGDMLRAEWELLEACFSEPGTPKLGEPRNGASDAEVPRSAIVRTVANDRFAELIRREQSYQQIPLDTLLSFLFIGAEFPESVDLQNQLFRSVSSSVRLAQRLRESPSDVATEDSLTRQIVTRWLLKTSQLNSIYEMSAIVITSRFRMFDEAKLLAEYVLQNKVSQPVTKSTAMQIFAALRDPRGIPLIEPFLQDETQLRSQGKILQMRDVALVCLMDLNGHDVTKRLDVKRINNLLTPYDHSTLGFETPSDREKAVALFEELQAEKAFQEKKEKPAEGKIAP